METFRAQSEELQERVNEILMDSKLSIIVEGEHDILAYELFFDEDNSHIEEFHGKEDAEIVIREVNKVNSSRAIAILDKDLDAINGKEYPKNVFLTDAHDIDAQMFLSNAFYRVAREYYTRANTTPKLKLDGIRHKIITFARPLSYMRVLNAEEGFKFAFKASKDHPKEFPYRDFLKLSKTDCEYRGDAKMVETVCRYRNQGAGIDLGELEEKIKQIALRGYDDQEILHGHDLMSLMGLLLLHYGKTNAKIKKNDEVEQDFRLAYYSDFKNSSLYASLQDYSKNYSISFLRDVS